MEVQFEFAGIGEWLFGDAPSPAAAFTRTRADSAAIAAAATTSGAPGDFADGVVHRREASTGAREVLQLAEQLCRHHSAIDQICCLHQLVVFACACHHSVRPDQLQQRETTWGGGVEQGGCGGGGRERGGEFKIEQPPDLYENLDLLAQLFRGRVRVVVLEEAETPLPANPNRQTQFATRHNGDDWLSSNVCEASRCSSCWCECIFRAERSF